MDGHSVVLSHLNNKKARLCSTLGDKIRRTQIFCNTKSLYLVKLVDADDSAVGQHHGSTLHDESAGGGVPQHGGSQTSCTAALT